MTSNERHNHGFHPSCPNCGSDSVGRMLVAQLRMDSCACADCGERWDEDVASGKRRNRSDRSSVLLRSRGH